MTLIPQLQAAVDAWVASGGDEQKEQAVHAILDTPEYRSLPYLERNRPFVTSSKLKEFQACPYHAKLHYVDEAPTDQGDEDYFLIGSAVDTWITNGEESFRQGYLVGSRTSKEFKALIEANPSKPTLTPSSGKVVEQAAREYYTRDFFPKTPQKRNVLFLLHGLPCKAELDAFDAETRTIGDIKTTASITTFDPQMYALQMAFYALGIEKRFGEKVSAELFVVDKHSGYSRSHKWVFSQPTLQSHFFEVEELARQWKESVESEIWPHINTATDDGLRTCWNSPYWSVCPFCKTAPASIL